MTKTEHCVTLFTGRWRSDNVSRVFAYATPTDKHPIMPVMEVRGAGHLRQVFGDDEATAIQKFLLQLVAQVPDMVQTLKDVMETAALSPELKAQIADLLRKANYKHPNQGE